MNCGRAPQGARGLKSTGVENLSVNALSRPARGAWIEISSGKNYADRLVSRPARGAWIEIIGDPIVETYTGRRAPQGARGLKSCGQCAECRAQ